MRFFLLLLTICFPLLGAAQAEFVPGTYELANGTKGSGLLSYETGPKARLLVRDPKADPASKAGQKAQEFAASKVRAFTVAGDRYVGLRNITLNSGKPDDAVALKNDFAKLIVEGKLELLEYTAPEGVLPAPALARPPGRPAARPLPSRPGARPVPVPGRPAPAAPAAAPEPAAAPAPAPAGPPKLYLLRRQGEPDAFSFPTVSKTYRAMIAAFFEGRPDLIKKAGLKPLPNEDLRELVKAYNAGTVEQ